MEDEESREEEEDALYILCFEWFLEIEDGQQEEVGGGLLSWPEWLCSSSFLYG